MKLSELARAPKLIEVTLDDEKIVEEFGEPISFWTWDRQPMDAFLRLAQMTSENTASIIETVRDLILDEHGKPVLQGDTTLPTNVMMAAIYKITALLGKF